MMVCLASANVVTGFFRRAGAISDMGACRTAVFFVNQLVQAVAYLAHQLGVLVSTHLSFAGSHEVQDDG